MPSASNGSRAGRGGAAAGPATVDYDRIFNQLCHVVALSGTSKRPQVIEGLIEGLLADSPEGVLADNLPELLRETFGLVVPPVDVDAAWRRMVVAGNVKNSKSCLTLSALRVADVKARSAGADELERRVRSRWLVRCSEQYGFPADSTQLWCVLRGYMASVFRQHGIRAAALLTSSPDRSVSDVTSLAEELERAAAQQSLPVTAELSAAVTDFFTDLDPDRASYLAQLLDATFTFFALSTPAMAADYLRKSLQPLKLFLDTNTLFDLLGLHDDPGATDDLVQFISRNELPIELLVHEQTVKEFNRTVDQARDQLLSRTWSPNLSKAALTDPELNGFLRRFHSANAEGPIDPRAFMSRFEHVTELLRSHGITVYRDGPHYQDEEKALLVEEYRAFLNDTRPDKAEKHYGVLDHDIAVLLDCRGERRPGASALDCGSLFVTNDVSLFRFEYRRTDRRDIPAVTLASQLLQVLRPFGVPTAALNERFVEMFAIPDFRVAHSDYAETRTAVRGYLAAFEDIPAETAANILGNQVLLQKLQGLDEDDNEFRELIDDAVVRENARLIEERQDFELRALAAEEAGRRLVSELDEVERARVRAERAAEARIAEVEADAARVRQELADAEGARASTEGRLLTVEGRLNQVLTTQQQEQEQREASARKRRNAGALAVGIVLAVLVIWGPDHLSWMHAALGWHGRKGVQAFALVTDIFAVAAVWFPSHRRDLFYGGVVMAVGSIVSLLAG